VQVCSRRQPVRPGADDRDVTVGCSHVSP
jgi:hypothetical protein